MNESLKITLYFICLGILCSCGQKNNEVLGYTSADVDLKDKITSTWRYNPDIALPDACQLLSPSTVAKAFDVEEIYIDPIDGNPGGTDVRSCFYKWDDRGIMLQIQTNPMPDELPDWAAYAVANKRTTGENIMGESEPRLFKNFPGVGNDGSYNYDIGKYYWRIEHDLVLLLAFNMSALDITETKQKSIAYTVAEEVMANLSRIAAQP